MKKNENHPTYRPNSLPVSTDAKHHMSSQMKYHKQVQDVSSSEYRNHSGHKHTKSKRSCKQKFLRAIVIFLVVLSVLSLGLGITYEVVKEHYMSKINIVPTVENPTMINEDGSIIPISDMTTKSHQALDLPVVEGIHNILLIGVDSRSESYSSDGSGTLADVIMIMTVNENDDSIKLTAIQRDSYVYIPGYTDPQKINAAMTYGGPELLMQVIEDNLRIELTEYAYVNFYYMEKVIDAVGGVTVNVSEEERTNVLGGLNELVAEQNTEFGSESGSHMLSETGNVLLDGRQAVAYARIRKVGNGDYDRSKRQIEVLTSLLQRYMNMSVSGKASALGDILSMITTNIQEDQLEWYALTFLPKLKSLDLDYLQMPSTDYANQGMFYDIKSKGEWSIRPDWNRIIPVIQEFIFDETFAFDPVKDIPGAPTAEDVSKSEDETDP